MCIVHFESPDGKRYCFISNTPLRQGVQVVTLGALHGTYVVTAINPVGSNGDVNVRIRLVPNRLNEQTSMSVDVRVED